MTAYMVIDARIHDMEKFAAYSTAAAELVAQFGGRYLALREPVTALEGELGDTRLVISVWPSREAALSFWNSPQYAEVRQLREGIADCRVLLKDGMPDTSGGSS